MTGDPTLQWVINGDHDNMALRPPMSPKMQPGGLSWVWSGRGGARVASLLLALPGAATAQTDSGEPPTAPSPPPPPPQEEVFTLDGGASPLEPQAPQSFWDSFGENLRVNIDVVGRISIDTHRGEPWSFLAAGLDIHKVFSDEKGDIGTMLLQPYVVRRDNTLGRAIQIDGDNSFAIELHDFYFNLTRFGRGRTNIKVGHFNVPFGLEPIVDTHLTLRQFTPLHDAGFKFDWGASLNGSLPEFDYEVALTTGTGMDLTGLDQDPYLVSGRIGTPSDRNRIFGLSALYGEVIDEHGAHRVDERDPRGDFRELDGFVRRLRVGGDFTQIIGQFTLRAQISGGQDFDQSVFNALGEIDWTTSDEKFSAYLQLIQLGQDGQLGWDQDLETRLGFLWKIDNNWKVSGQWIHDFSSYFDEVGGLHFNTDIWSLQLRFTL